MRRLFLTLTFLALASPAFAWTSTSCPGGTYDMLAWIYPGPQPSGPPWYSAPFHQENAGPAPQNDYPAWLWTTITTNGSTPGDIIQVKAQAGWPWDIMKYDSNYIYYYETGLDFSDPTNVGIFIPAVPAFKRCAHGGFPGDVLVSSTVGYNTYAHGNCGLYHGGQQAIQMSLWGPYSYRFGAETVAYPTLVLAYERNYANGHYQHKENEMYQQGFGFVRWELWDWNGSAYVLNQYTDLSRNTSGSTPAYVNQCGY